MSTALQRATAGRCVLVVSRFRVPVADGEAFRAELAAAHAVLAERPGYVDGEIGRNVDDPTLWVLSTRWENVGAYRRALSSYDVKLQAVPLLSRAIDEPSGLRGRRAGDRPQYRVDPVVRLRLARSTTNARPAASRP